MWNISTTLNSENIKKNFRMLRNLLIKSIFFLYIVVAESHQIILMQVSNYITKQNAMS